MTGGLGGELLIGRLKCLRSQGRISWDRTADRSPTRMADDCTSDERLSANWQLWHSTVKLFCEAMMDSWPDLGQPGGVTRGGKLDVEAGVSGWTVDYGQAQLVSSNLLAAGPGWLPNSVDWLLQDGRTDRSAMEHMRVNSLTDCNEERMSVEGCKREDR